MEISGHISIPNNEITYSFFHASGPGGQNINKVETAVQLRFDVRKSPSLPDEIKKRLEIIAGNKLTRDGVLKINAKRFRTQIQNRLDAENRLRRLIQNSVVRPALRRPTRPSETDRINRLNAKKKKSLKKIQRKYLDLE